MSSPVPPDAATADDYDFDFDDTPAHVWAEYAYRCEDEDEEVEVSEFFSLTECLSSSSSSLLSTDDELYNAIVCLDSANTQQRIQARDRIVITLRQYRKQQSDRLNVLFDGCVLQLTLDTLPLAVDRHCQSLRTATANSTTATSDGDGDGGDGGVGLLELNKVPEFWQTLHEFRQHLNTIFLMLMIRRHDKEFMHMYKHAQCGGDYFVVYLFRLLASPCVRYFPVKKIMVLIRWHLLHALGPIVGRSDTREQSLKRSKKERGPADAPKVYVRDLRAMIDRYTKVFSPIFLEYENGRVSFVCVSRGLPAAVSESINILIRRLTESGYNWIEWFQPSTPPQSSSSSSSSSNDDEKKNHDDEEEEEKIDWPEELYAQLWPELEQHVAIMVEALVVCLPGLSVVPGLLDTRIELCVDGDSMARLSRLERVRHGEVLMKSITYIILRLLKSWRHGSHPQQADYFATLLQQRNMCVLILKYMRHDVDSMCSRDTTCVELTNGARAFLASPDEQWAAISACQPTRPCTSKRNCFSFITLIRILHALTKRSTVHKHMLARFRAHEILADTLKTMQYLPEMRYHLLKLFKNIISVCGTKWRQSPQALRIVSQIFHHVPNRMFESWTDEEEALTKEQHEELMHQLTTTRDALRTFNHTKYGTNNNNKAMPIVADAYGVVAEEMTLVSLSMEEQRHYAQLVGRMLSLMPDTHWEIDNVSSMLHLVNVPDWASIPPKQSAIDAANAITAADLLPAVAI